MKPQDLGLIFIKGIRPVYFTHYVVEEEGLGDEHLLVTLLDGSTVTVSGYYSKREERMIKAKEAILREPREDRL